MKKTLIPVLTLVLLPASLLAQIRPDVIYGKDDRLDLYQVQDSRMLSLADSTVALFSANSVTIEGDKARLYTSPFGESKGLCKDEPFYDQYKGAFCSGSLVGPDTLMTAGHCVTSQEDCESTRFVFGFSIKNASVKNPNELPASEIYGCKKLLLREQAGADWALVRLDRRVTGHKPLILSFAGDPSNGTPLFVIGHPSGLPTKVAGGAKVRDSSPNGYFVANLDTYGGNSGSAVFNAQTWLIEGILVRGETDYVSRGDCYVSNVCANDACRGEDVTKISAIIPPHLSGGEKALAPASVAPIGQNLALAIKKLAAAEGIDFDRP